MILQRMKVVRPRLAELAVVCENVEIKFCNKAFRNISFRLHLTTHTQQVTARRCAWGTGSLSGGNERACAAPFVTYKIIRLK
jgi:hypothetical protein